MKNGYPQIEDVFVKRDSAAEKEIQNTEPVMWSGTRKGGRYYLGVCVDRSEGNCSQCMREQNCRHSLSPRKVERE